MTSFGKQYQEWLDGLKVGDQVAIVSDGAAMQKSRMLTVQRRTKTMLVIGNEQNDNMYRFRTNGGEPVGERSRFNSPYLCQPTAKVQQQVAWAEIERRARDLGMRLSRNVIIPPQRESRDVDELDRALGVLKQAMDAVDAAWATLRGDKQ